MSVTVRLSACCNGLMHINPYGEEPVRLACELANDPPNSLAQLRSRCAEADLVVEGRPSRADLETTLRFLDAWLEVVDAPSDAARAGRLNALLAEHSEHPRLTNHAGDGWHVHYRGRRSLGSMLAVVVSVGTAMHLTARGMHRLGRCGATDCDRVYADTSRNGQQAYCSPRCGSRSAVRRHRARAS